jgi:phage virion morphogenesis protein
MSVSITLSWEGMDSVDRALSRLDPIDANVMLTGIGRMIQEQTRRRITSEKRGPDGKGWKANRAGTSTLYRSGALARSIDMLVNGNSVIVGSGLVYAGIHQFGGTIHAKTKKVLMFRIGNQWVSRKSVTIPARPYLGLSSENREDIVDQVSRFIKARLG